MTEHQIASRAEWNAARQQLLAKEKEFTRLRDELSRQRRALPWERVEKSYVFESDPGTETLADLFAGRHQLVVYHFMYAPDWDIGCKSCSFWADNFNGIIAHLNARDVSFAAVSRAPLAKLQAQARRLGWTFKWVSSAGTDFNYDYQVSFKPAMLAAGEVTYNYTQQKSGSADLPGISVFYQDEDDGRIYHTYSCYSRGLDMLNTAYHYLDLVPKGRDEDRLRHPMEWVRLRDAYGK
jgi:predicted dithiol-disulfide oxidoreductase (DUF899 family)